MKLILAILFAFLALSMGFRSRLSNKNFMQNTVQTHGNCPSDCDPQNAMLCDYLANNAGCYCSECPPADGCFNAEQNTC
jgi:hypothetical protein